MDLWVVETIPLLGLDWLGAIVAMQLGTPFLSAAKSYLGTRRFEMPPNGRNTGISFATFMPQAKLFRGLILRSAARGVSLLLGLTTPAKHGGPSFFPLEDLGIAGYRKWYVSTEYALHEAILYERRDLGG